MASIVEICNSALVKLGAAPVMSIDGDDKEGNRCKVRFPLVKRIVLRSHPWNCAIQRVQLAPLTEAPPFGYTYCFQMPVTLVRLLDVGDDIPYVIEGRKILCDASSLDIKYVADIDVSLLDELLCEAIACYLAWDISYAITQSGTVREDMWKAWELCKRSAKTVDAQEERDQHVEANLFVDSRIGGVPNPDA